MKSKLWVIIIKIFSPLLRFEYPCSDSSLNSRWPATMLVASRIANVAGRIVVLINSARAIKGIKTHVVLRGIK